MALVVVLPSLGGGAFWSPERLFPSLAKCTFHGALKHLAFLGYVAFKAIGMSQMDHSQGLHLTSTSILVLSSVTCQQATTGEILGVETLVKAPSQGWPSFHGASQRASPLLLCTVNPVLRYQASWAWGEEAEEKGPPFLPFLYLLSG
jgi:hypothetical protein